MRPVHELESPQTVLVWAKRRTAACTIRMTALTDEMNDAKRLDNVKRWLDVLMAEAILEKGHIGLRCMLVCERE